MSPAVISPVLPPPHHPAVPEGDAHSRPRDQPDSGHGLLRQNILAICPGYSRKYLHLAFIVLWLTGGQNYLIVQKQNFF